MQAPADPQYALQTALNLIQPAIGHSCFNSSSDVTTIPCKTLLFFGILFEV